jgi:hypothetical protein
MEVGFGLGLPNRSREAIGDADAAAKRMEWKRSGGPAANRGAGKENRM